MNDAATTGRILVADDEPVNLLVLKGVLTKAGHEVVCAASGAECLAKARETQPDMILLDVMMPGQSGFDICRKLKAEQATAHIPVMFISSLGDTADKLEGLGLGAVDYVTKPFIAAEVQARVSAQMGFVSRQRRIIDAQADRLGQVNAAQRALLTLPQDLPHARFAVHYLPVLEAGGDFYDVVDLGAGRWAYIMADVSGHDLGASFLTPSLKALFRQHAAQHQTPEGLLRAMNAVLCAITAEEVYMTAACLFLDRSAGAYRIASAGHPRMLALQGGACSEVEVGGLPLGLFPEADFEGAQGRAATGDRFFLYTDGLAENAGHLVTSQAFRMGFAASCLHNAPLPLANAVENSVRDLSAPGDPVDDVVLLGVEA